MPYDLIYTDPPWTQTKGNLRKSRPNQGKTLDYKTLSIEQIEKIHAQLDVSPKHNVFMWTIDKFLHQSEQMMERLGYNLHARMIWDKTNGIAPAFTIRFAHEYLLWFYKKGNILMPAQPGKFTTVFREPATIHSRKPEIAYQMLEQMFPEARKLELFARRHRDGWDSWGDELPVISTT